jgi:SAM-dependent methyltransferase
MSESAQSAEKSDYQRDIANDALGYVRLEQARNATLRARLLSSFGRKRLPLQGARVLVVGCAEGKDCTFFVEFGAREVHGLDVIERIGKDFPHPRVTYHRCSAEEMKLPSDGFDLVYSVATMEHIPNIERAFAEMVRVARPRGMIYCFSAPLWNSREGHHKFGLFPDDPWIHLRMSRDEMLEHCRRSGIRSTSEWGIESDVDFIFSDYFNREPGARFVEVCSKLPVSRFVENTLSHEPETVLPESLAGELARRGYAKSELLALWHKLVAVK